MASGNHNIMPGITFPTSLPPTGPAAGDLGGAYPNPNVVKLQGYAVSTSVPAPYGQLQYNLATAKYECVLPKIRTVAINAAILASDDFVIVDNVAVAITLTLPAPASCPGKCVSLTRNATSTGAVTISTSAGSMQNLTGTLTATTTLALHSAAGAGLRIEFKSDGVNWYR